MKLNRWSGRVRGRSRRVVPGSPLARSRRHPIPRTRESASSPGSATPAPPPAAWSCVANLPKPEGFFDPEAPAGVGDAARTRARGAARARRRRPARRRPRRRAGSGFTNSDLAFFGTNVVVGNYHGFNIYDVENARQARG